MGSQGVPMMIWGPIMDIESGGNPSARLKNGNEDSIGLFALNRQGGLGTGYTVEQLSDPKVNATIASQALGPAYKRGVAQGLSGLDLLRFTAYNSGWPTTAGVNALTYDRTVQDYDRKLVQEFSYGEGGGGILSTSQNIELKTGAMLQDVSGKFNGLNTTQKLLIMAGTAFVILLSSRP